MVTFSCTLHRVVKIIDYVTLCAIQNNLLIFIVWNISAPATSGNFPQFLISSTPLFCPKNCVLSFCFIKRISNLA